MHCILMHGHLSFSLAAGFPRAEHVEANERVPRALRDGGSMQDVFVLVKATMASPGLCQPATLVWPAALRGEADRFLQRVHCTDKIQTSSFDEDRLGEFAELLTAFERDFPSLQRTHAYYRSLLSRDPNEQAQPFTDLSFLRNIASDAASLRDLRPPPRQVPPKPHNLQVVFHREA